MGQLIVLPRKERPSQPVMRTDGGAQILFFTGVRYHRMPDEVPPQAVKPPRRRQPTAREIRAEAQVDRHV